MGAINYPNRRIASVRQTVLSGWLDSDGYPLLFYAPPFTSYTIEAIDDISLTIASGFNKDGTPKDFFYTIPKGTQFDFGSPPTLENLKLYWDWDVKDFGYLPEAQKVTYALDFPSSPAVNDHCYIIHWAKMYYWDGDTWNHVNRVFLGEYDWHSVGNLNDQDVYAYCGFYDSGDFSVASGTNYIKLHFIGTDLIDVKAYGKTTDGYAEFGNYQDTSGNTKGAWVHSITNTTLELRTGVEVRVIGDTGTFPSCDTARIIARRAF